MNFSPRTLLQVHWLVETEKLPLEYFEGLDGRLYQRLAPGFVVRFFNYIPKSVKESLEGVVYGMSEQWPHPPTYELVSG